MAIESPIQGVKEDLPSPANIVIFGASGDLTKRKLIPALARMFRTGLVHPQSRIIGVARDSSESDWPGMMRTALDSYATDLQYSDEEWQAFAARLRFVAGDLAEDDTYTRLAGTLETDKGPVQCPVLSRHSARVVRTCRAGTGHGAARQRGHGLPAYRHREAVWPGSCLRRRTQHGAAGRIHRGADLPHRSLPRQGKRAEPVRIPLRQQHPGTAVEPQLHRPRADLGD